MKIKMNTKSYQLPYQLMHIAQQIEEAQDILRYEFDWDDEGAFPADIMTFENAKIMVDMEKLRGLVMKYCTTS